MRGEQIPNIDPYRTLGLEPGASMAEVKRAYRLLAKAFHPDSAGEAALPRFLAIHEAYEQLRTGRAPSVPRASRPPAAPPAEPWRADPARARAARERARAGKGRTTAGGASAAGAAGARGGSTAGGTTTGRGGPQGRPTSTSSGAGSTGRTGRRQVRKATMGSTSYDDARDHADATWSGASWYGPSTGEYWIVNPREYADPRKHGPEYQSRTRRPADGQAFDAVAGAEFPNAATASRAAAMGGASTAAGTSTAAGPTTAAGAATAERPPAVQRGQATSRASWAAASADRAWANDAAGPRPGERPRDGDPLAAAEAATRRWLGGPTDDPIRRLGLALVAWPPIGLAAAAAIGDLTGCSVYSASCDGSEPLLPWLAQAAILGILLLLPPLTRVLAGGAFAVLLAVVPIAFFLLAVGGSGAPQAGYVFAVLLGGAWLVGVGWATRASLRRASAATAATAARAGP